MPNPKILQELPPETVAKMGKTVKTPEDEAKLKDEMAEERKRQLEEQMQNGKMLLCLALFIIAMGWYHGYVAWQFDYVAQAVGLPRFPLPEDLAAFADALVSKVRSKFQEKLLEQQQQPDDEF